MAMSALPHHFPTTGCGANCAFMTLPAQLAATARPVLTGWLADPLVLSPGSRGISFGSQARRDKVGLERQEIGDATGSEWVGLQGCWQAHLCLGAQRYCKLVIHSPAVVLRCRSVSAQTWRCRAARPPSCCRCSLSTTSCRQGKGGERQQCEGSRLFHSQLGRCSTCFRASIKDPAYVLIVLHQIFVLGAMS